MAVNLQVTPGTGATIAFDEVTIFSTTAKTQVVKLSVGADNAHDGLVDDAFPLPVGGFNSLALGKKNDQASTATDVGVALMGVRADSAAALTDTDGDWSEVVVSQYGALIVNPDRTYQVSDANGLLKAEDAAHASGDAGVMPLAVRNDTPTSLAGTDGDYTPIAVDEYGQVKTLLATGVTGPAKLEDSAHSSGDMGVFALGVRADGLSALTSTDGDYSPIAVDRYGRPRVVVEPSVEPNGVSTIRDIDCNTTAQQITTVEAMLYGFLVYNDASSVRWLKFYNVSSSPTVGTTTPFLTIGLAPNKHSNIWFPQGIPFSTGIFVAATTGVADSDTGAPAANKVVGNFFYET